MEPFEELVNDDPEFVVQGYQFEPVFKANANEIKESSSECSEEENDSDPVEVLPCNTDWCSCSNCVIMETTRECKCCFGIPDVARKVHKGNLKCITEHDSFVVNCLNHHVLKLSNYEYMQDNGPIGDDEPVNELYRHLAYRRFARFIWKRLGRYNRRILPSCVVDAIRKQFPSQQYCGFRYPGEEK